MKPLPVIFIFIMIFLYQLNCLISKRIVLFRSSNLRTINQPCLDYALEKGESFDCIFLKEKIFDDNDLYSSFIDAATKDLSSRLMKKNFDLKIIEGDGDKLISYIKSEYKKSEAEIVWASSPINPFSFYDDKLLNSFEKAEVCHHQVWDGLIPRLKRPRSSDQTSLSEMRFNRFRNAYNLNNIDLLDTNLSEEISSLSTHAHDNETKILSGESLALKYIRDYILLGDDQFTEKYMDKFLEEHSTSREHKLALQRLTTDTVTEDNYLFEGEVFSSLMLPLTTLGCISPKLMARARRYLLSASEFLSVDRPLECKVRQDAVRRDWHRQIVTAAKEIDKETKAEACNKKNWNISYRSWNGYIVREAVMKSNTETNTNADTEAKPAIIMVHGFGGSIEQFTDVASELSDNFSVIALDSIGFGHSEKPPVSYNQYLWRDQVVDVASRVEELTGWKGPVILAGNSIGGFSATSAAAVLANAQKQKNSNSDDTNNSIPDCSGLILFNSAGRIVDGVGLEVGSDDDSDAGLFRPYTGPPVPLLRIFGLGIFSLLQPNIARTCEWLYPTNPGIVAQGLARNIARDSEDPGAPLVLAAGGKLPRPRAVNALFKEFSGPVLVCQGALDPLNDAPMRAKQFEAIRSGVTVDLLDYGHCVMEEGPSDVAKSVLNWSQQNNLMYSLV